MITNPERWLQYSNGVYFFAAILSILATGGAIWFGKLASEAKDQQLKKYQNQANLKIADSNKIAAQAIRQAAEANETAELARRQTEVLRKERVELELQLNSLRVATEAHSSHIYRIEEDAIARKITAQQWVQLSARLQALVRSHTGSKLFAEVDILSSELESQRYGEQIRNLLIESGLTCKLVYRFTDSVRGLSITFSSFNPFDNAFGLSIDQWFKEYGIPHQTNLDPSLSKGLVVISVGTKLRRNSPPY